jgi:DNA polymerase-1
MPKIFDTLTASHLLDENLPENGLKYLTRLYLNKEVTEYSDAIKYGTDSKEFAEYATDDAINTFLLFKKFSPEISKQGLSKLFYQVEIPFQKALMWLAINGIKGDVNAAKQMTYEIQHLYYEIENTLLEYFGGQYNVGIMPKARRVFCEPSINFNSSDQVVPLIEGLGFEIYERSKKAKKKSWNKQSKERLKGKHEIIDLLIKLGKVSKLLNTFLIPFEEYIDADGRIRCSFHNSVCVTGRLSCSKPNIEQLPKNNDIANIRNLFIADTDNVLIVADYGGQELRIMAEESGDRAMLKSLRAGFDIHLQTANDFNELGLDNTQLTEGTPEHKKAKTLYKPQRDDCKSVGFGIAYGKGAYGFSRDFGWSEEKAQEFIDRFLDRYPGLRRAIEKTKEQVYKYGYVKNMAGRKRRFPDFHKKNKWGKERCYRMAFNFKIQGMGADVIKKACSEIVKDNKLKLVNVVHDEAVVECPKVYVEQGIAYIKQCMVSALPLSIPWTTEIAYGERYGDCK